MVSCGVMLSEVGLAELRKPQVAGVKKGELYGDDRLDGPLNLTILQSTHLVGLQ